MSQPLAPLEKAASGALASVIANTLVYPLDLGKTLIQTQVKKHEITEAEKADPDGSIYAPQPSAKGQLKYKSTLDALQKIYEKKGVLGWYHGLFSSLLGTAAQNFSYFYWYTIVKRVYAKMYKHIPHHKPTTLTELFLGALAAAISQLFTMPIGVITTQQQTDKEHRNLAQLTKEIYEQDGITGLWKGLRVSLILCINPSITYGSYERLKTLLYGSKQFLGPIENFSLGVLSKSMATVATQPLIVSKAMLQKKHDKKDSEQKTEGEDGIEVKFHSFQHALVHLWKTEQLKGLYKGIAPQLLKGIFVQGLLFAFKDQIDILFIFLLNALKSRKKLLKVAS